MKAFKLITPYYRFYLITIAFACLFLDCNREQPSKPIKVGFSGDKGHVYDEAKR